VAPFFRVPRVTKLTKLFECEVRSSVVMRNGASLGAKGIRLSPSLPALVLKIHPRPSA
jgi:hypothetical protein